MSDSLPIEQRALLASHVFPIKQVVPEGRFSWERIVRCTILPWVILSLLVLILSLKFRYDHPALSTFVVFAIALCGLAIATRDVQRANSMLLRRWAFYKICMVSLACLLGTHLGEYFFNIYTKHYYDLHQLGRYKGVDPSTTHGAQVFDAGVLKFTDYTSLDRGQAGCYQARTRFCIAPIVASPRGAAVLPATGSYDFFAVGKDCCNCPDQDFRCGDWDSDVNPGGLRMVDKVDTPYYQLAVDQWSAAYRRTAKTPIFIYWTSEADGNVRGMYQVAMTGIVLIAVLSLPVMFAIGVLAAFFIQRKETIPA
eukprot:GEMP01035788.1.p1 GENE.GEMP01035788.1~~GEMP01035788.1.p1  ORF type:complete len:310 (+),score=68.36 GEMP01035788.1:115-1044(+)